MITQSFKHAAHIQHIIDRHSISPLLYYETAYFNPVFEGKVSNIFGCLLKLNCVDVLYLDNNSKLLMKNVSEQCLAKKTTTKKPKNKTKKQNQKTTTALSSEANPQKKKKKKRKWIAASALHQRLKCEDSHYGSSSVPSLSSQGRQLPEHR